MYSYARAAMAAPASTPLARLISDLDLEPREANSFVGYPGDGEGRVFGGLIAAQAVVACGRTVRDRRLHSLHGYFIRPGRHGAPIRFDVTRLRDGTAFATRSVLAQQAGRAIFILAANFTRREQGLSHQENGMPDAPQPLGLPEWEDVRAALLGDPAKRRPDGPIEVRVCDPESRDPQARLRARRRVWLRPRGTLPDDPLVHAAVLVFASDRTLLGTAARPHGLAGRLPIGASLDHAVWLHHPLRFDDWLLYATESPVSHAGRALLLGAMYNGDGARVASVAQEGLLRS